MANLKDLVTATSAQDLMVQTLKDAGFEGDLTPGSPIYQLLIDPNAILYTANVAKQDEVKNSWSLLSGSADVDTPIDFQTMENLFNNLRILPSAGSRASGEITLLFTDNLTRNLASANFISEDGTIFTPKLPYTLVASEADRTNFSASELVYTPEPSGYSATISVEASTVGSVSIGSGDRFTTTLNGLTAAYAATSFSGGADIESIEDLIKDIPDVLSETSLVSPISVVSALKSEFETLNEIIVFRPGDPEMLRANKNPLGVASGSADVVVTTSKKPSVSRRFIQGHVELAIDENGVFYNGQHKIGYAYRPGSGSEDTEQTFPDEVLNDFVYVNGSLTDRSLTGALYVLRSDLKKDSTLTTTSLSADDSVQDNLSVLDRGLVRDNRYGDLPVEGSDETDFYFSSYQNRLNFEFRTTWEEIEGVSQGTYDRVYKWLSFWVNYYKDSTNVDLLSQIATSFDASLSIETMPTTFRPEMQIYADIVYYTGLADIQSFLNDNSRRCFGQDYVVKTPGVNAVSLAISVSRDANFLRYREESFKTKIADYISSKGLSHTTPITTEHIKSLIFDEGPSTVNDKFTMLVTTSVVKKDGTTESVTRDYLDYLEDPDLGITPRNSVFVCSSKNITISYE